MKLLLINRSSVNLSSRQGLKAGLLLAGLVLALPVAAQPGRTTPPKPRGKIEEAEIEIVKERVNQLPEATRNFDKIRLPAPPQTERKVTYTFPDFRLPADRLNPSVRVLTIRQEEPAPLMGKYVKVGIGNYGTFFGRAHLHSTRTSDLAYGVDLRHVNSLNGPVDAKNSAVSESSATLMGEKYLGSTAVGATVDLGHERYKFYGYDRSKPQPEAGSIGQAFSRGAVKAYAHNRDPQQQLQYDAGLGFKYWKDNFVASESNFTINGKAGYALGETSRVTLAADASFIADKDSGRLGSRTRSFVQGTPAYELTGKRISVMLGATIGYSSDTINNVSPVLFNPAVRVGYTLVPEKFTVYAGLGGAIQRVTRYDLSTENPWLNQGLQVGDTRRGPTVYGGFNSTPVRGLELNARATYSRDKNLYFYLNNPVNPAKFDLVYDRETTQLLNVHGELLYTSAEKFRLGTRLDYNMYTLGSLAKPFHRPEFQSSVFGTYNAFDKLLLGVEAYFYSASYGISYTSNGDKSVPDFYRATNAIYDLNLRADYRITPNLSIFVMGNNLANQQYQRFYRYPVKGINVIGGASYSF
ncbi:TonB-dependent receptor [Hymenobacter saemangeumensis]|uniref:TonB-dependent receptor n=1 Tax=Hymenobacter saemangeumensis TaxID=1084522 RepID=A0ABP8IE50_9BACT